jgi:hypothetical protein
MQAMHQHVKPGGSVVFHCKAGITRSQLTAATMLQVFGEPVPDQLKARWQKRVDSGRIPRDIVPFCKMVLRFPELPIQRILKLMNG